MEKNNIKGIIVVAVIVVIIIVLNIRLNEYNKARFIIEDRDIYQEYVDAICENLSIEGFSDVSIEALDDNTYIILNGNGAKYLFIKYEEENYGRFIKTIHDVSCEYDNTYMDHYVLRINFNADYKGGTKGCFPDFSRRMLVIKLNKEVDAIYVLDNSKDRMKEVEIQRFEGAIDFDKVVADENDEWTIIASR